MRRTLSTTRLLIPASARFGARPGDLSSIPSAPLAGPVEIGWGGRARKPSLFSRSIAGLRDRLLERWSRGDDLDRIVVDLAQALSETELAPSRLSLVIIPAYATLDGMQRVWSAATPDELKTLHRSFGFLDDPEHLVSPLHAVLESGAWLREVPSRASTFPFLRELAERGATDYVALPLPHRSAAPSILSLVTSRPGGWTDQHLEELGQVAAVLALMVEVVEAQRLLQLAATDPLTGLANRRSFDHSLRRAWALCERSATPLSLAYFDIDHFKRFNDGYGHSAGDRCIAQVANAVASGSSLRATDTVARLGGEEFAVILPSCQPSGAEGIGQRLRSAVERLQIPHAFSSVADAVTISVGMATLVPGNGTSAAGLIELADEALYEAKAAGRNRVACRAY